MFQPCEKFVKCLMVMCALWGCFAFSATAQVTEKPVDEVEIPVLYKFGTKNFGCFTQNHVVDEAMFQRLVSAPNLKKECAEMYQSLDVDFARQTLISYSSGGDCALFVTARVFRNHQTKAYTVRIRNGWGGCRAAGRFQEWLIIPKIPADYKVEFAETRVSRFSEKAIDEEFVDLNPQSLKMKASAPEILETRSIDMKGCIRIPYKSQFVIKDEETYLKSIRNDASRERCLKAVEKIDFDRHSLIGIEINSGYCRVPLGLAYRTFKNKAKKQYVLSISYIAPQETCRALSQYDLWVLVPKIPDGYGVGFEVTAEPSVRANLTN